MFLIILIACVVILIWILLSGRNRFAHLSKAYPGFTNFPVIGSIHYFLMNPEKDLLKIAVTWPKKYGLNFMFYIFNQPYLSINDPRTIEFVLSSNKLIDKSREYAFLKNWFGSGLLTSTGTRWKNHRKVLTSSFHYRILEEFVKIFEKQSTKLIKQLRREVDKESFDIFRHISLCTLDVICETAMGTEVNAQEDPDSPFVTSVRELCSILYSRCFTPLRFNWIYYFSKTYEKEKKVVKVMRTFSNGIIKARKKAIGRELEDGCKDVDVEDEGIGIKRKYTFLDCLLRSKIDGEALPDEDVREQVDTFMFAGHDTTAVGISFTLFCLSKNLDVQEKAYEETVEVYNDQSSGKGLLERLNNLKYLEQVIKEGLRLYPPVSNTARIVEEDVTHEGVLWPKGLSLVISPYLMHRLPSIYPDPDKFDPERFTVDNQAKRDPFSYIPFSAGPRNCIGQKFAMLEMKCVISKILRHYKVLPAYPDHEVEPMIKLTLESANGIKIKLKERH